MVENKCSRLNMHQDASSQIQSLFGVLSMGGTSISSPVKVVPVEAESFKVKLNTLKVPKLLRAKSSASLLGKYEKKKTGKHHQGRKLKHGRASQPTFEINVRV